MATMNKQPAQATQTMAEETPAQTVARWLEDHDRTNVGTGRPVLVPHRELVALSETIEKLERRKEPTVRRRRCRLFNQHNKV
jgi:hypothetical protein